MQAHLKMLTFHLMLTKTALCGWVWIKSAQFSKVLVSLVLQTFSFLFLRPIFLRWQIIIFHELKGRTMFFHWKGEVRLSPPPSYVIRPGKSWENFNSKFSANLDFKEFELQSLNWQLVYIPWKIKGARKKSSLIWIYQGALSVAIIVSEAIMDMPGKLTRWLTGWAIGHGCGSLSFNWKPRITFQITTFRKTFLWRIF